MKLLVIGATGSIGRQVVAQALDAGHTVSAFSRHPEALAIAHANLKPVTGDVLDETALRRAVTGQDAVVCVLGSKALTGTIRSEGTRAIVRAMQQTGVRRLICQSTLGAGESWNNLNFYWKTVMFGFLLRRVFADHQLQEQIVKQSGLDWTIVRPSAFIDGDRTGNYRHGFATDDTTTTLKISRADVADFLLAQVGSDSYLCQTPGLSY